MGAIILDKGLASDSKLDGFRVVSKTTSSSSGVGDRDFMFRNNGDYTAVEVTTDETNKTVDFEVRTHHLQEDNNVFIDWGDGSECTYLNAIEADKYNNDMSPGDVGDDEWNCAVSHTYETVGTFKISVFGNTYFGFRNGKHRNDSGKVVRSVNLITRLFEKDLPLATCVQNVSGLCQYALKLTSVHAPEYFDFSHIVNATNLFEGCTNLESVTGNKNHWFMQGIYSCANVFLNCKKLKTTTIGLPAFCCGTQINNFYTNCSSLETEITDLIPKTGFVGECVNFGGVFQGCAKLGVTKFDDVKKFLWKDYTKTWTSGNAFKGSSAESLAPKSWGGTLADETSDYGTLDDLETTMTALKKLVEKTGGSIKIVVDED